jgi:hypothetical protein
MLLFDSRLPTILERLKFNPDVAFFASEFPGSLV